MQNDVKLDFNDVLMVPRFSDVESRSQVDLMTTIKGVYGASITGVPIIAANMVGVGTFGMNRALAVHGLFTAIEKGTPVETWLSRADINWFSTMGRELYSTFVTVGMGDHELERLRILQAAGIFEVMKINIDVANGHMNKFPDFVSKVRDLCPDAFIIAGTVCTPEACTRLINHGADLARVGIGTGAVCTTRVVAGVGYPQFSAIQECKYGITYTRSKLAGTIQRLTHQGIVCDGGCYHPGDFAKAFGAGAKMVMAGSVFAGHVEGGILQDENGNVRFHGNAAIPEPAPDGNTYRSSEGRIVDIPFKGEVKNTVEHILGGIRSACAYSNSFNLEDLSKNAQFVRCNTVINKVIEHYTI